MPRTPCRAPGARPSSSWAPLRDPERLGAWLSTTAGRECLALIRRARRERPDDAAVEARLQPTGGPEDMVLAAEAARAVAGAVEALEPRRRQLVRELFYRAGTGLRAGVAIDGDAGGQHRADPRPDAGQPAGQPGPGRLWTGDGQRSVRLRGRAVGLTRCPEALGGRQPGWGTPAGCRSDNRAASPARDRMPSLR